ncbi:LysR family transcriptional regulator [Rhodococcus sp. BH5]|uniref:LysR family transcriptional regulator n=1 Tax=Rhodococcus sp. BH5 TaxID=2871702 RepID=UPI0022CD29ED|nr:LysR family transcriptional regulator [Rhodococcus sp. BH5]MCZ9635186.1 LysR family transcriptional regulator [Rhodococcus sp. BH5]
MSSDGIISSKVTLKQLEYYVHIVNAGTMTAAALQLNVTPSALSQQLATLEAALGRQLLHRSGGAMKPTAAGAEFFAHAQHIVSECERAWEVGTIGQSRRERVTIATLHEYSATFLGRQVWNLNENFKIDLISHFSENYSDQGKEFGSYHLSVMPERMNREQCVRKRMLGREEFLVAFPENEPRFLFGRENIAKRHWVGYSPHARGIRELFRTFFRNWNVRPRIELEVSDPTSALSIVSSDGLSALVPASISQFPIRGVKFSRLPIPLFRNIEICAYENSDKAIQIFNLLSVDNHGIFPSAETASPSYANRKILNGSNNHANPNRDFSSQSSALFRVGSIT